MMKDHNLCAAPRSAMPIRLSVTVGAMLGALMVSAPNAADNPQKYTGTIYVAGQGGHFAQAEVAIDPSNEDQPIQLTTKKLTVSMRKHPNGQSQYKIHDGRLDGDTLYWSTYNTDEDNNLHYGKVDLATKKVTDIAVPVDPRATLPALKPNVAPYYCASGQTKGYFMPMTMTHEAYITVADKSDLNKYKNVFLDKLLPDQNYKFLHGSTSHDGKKMFVVVNVADKPMGAFTGEALMYVLDATELEQGNVVKLAEGMVFGDGTGPFGASITFRSTWTDDDSKILMSGGDRFWVIDAATLKPLNGEAGDIGIGGQNHDAMATTDGKYAILTERVLFYDGGEEKMDGAIQLYDLQNDIAIGPAVSVCNSCHESMMDSKLNVGLCGLDGVVSPQPEKVAAATSGGGS